MKLSLRSIFRCMMEGGYYPTFEKTHIIFAMEDNLGVVEYEEGILSIRLFFSIDEDTCEMFMEASNITMQETYGVKGVVLDDMKNIMFSCEFPCDTEKEFRKFFPRGIELINDALEIHKAEMKKLILAESITSKAFTTTEEQAEFTYTSGRKVLS